MTIFAPHGVTTVCICGNSECQIPHGLCHCGCGSVAPTSKRNVASKGYIKGQPTKYIFGHFPPAKRLETKCVCGNADCSIPYGYCHCGCGGQVAICDNSNRSQGHFKGHPYQFIAHHQNIPHWTDAEINFLKSNINSVSYVNIAANLPGRTVDAVKQRAQLLGLEKTGRHFPRVWRRDDFFSIPNLLNSYWAGFIAADGCIGDKPRVSLRIGVHQKDRSHIQSFVDAVEYRGKVSVDKKKVFHVCIGGTHQWSADLWINFNIGPRKTFTLEPPSITGINALSFSVGYIDGDGCWSTDVAGRNSRRLILVVVGTHPLLRWLTTIWREAGAQIGVPNITFRRNVWRLALHGTKAEEVARILLPLNTPKLDRKWRVARHEAIGQEV